MNATRSAALVLACAALLGASAAEAKGFKLRPRSPAAKPASLPVKPRSSGFVIVAPGASAPARAADAVRDGSSEQRAQGVFASGPAPSPASPPAPVPAPTPGAVPVPAMTSAASLAPMLGGDAPASRVIGGWSVLN